MVEKNTTNYKAIAVTPFYSHVFVFIVSSKYVLCLQQTEFLFRSSILTNSSLYFRAIKTKSIIISGSLRVGKTTGSIRRKLERAFSRRARKCLRMFPCCVLVAHSRGKQRLLQVFPRRHEIFRPQ